MTNGLGCKHNISKINNRNYFNYPLFIFSLKIILFYKKEKVRKCALLLIHIKK